MGEVFQAFDWERREVVALKVMRGASVSDRSRFDREARALSELKHPAIVRYVAHGISPADEAYLAMEWLEGEDLASVLSRRRLSVNEALALTKRVAGALGEAHSRGMLHRDLKPSNLFLVNGDVRQAKLLDFGIALMDERTRMTQAGVPVGTPGYMAPEQARGELSLTPALDIFALGCVLFEALSGRPAFEGGHAMAVLAKLVFADAPRLRDHCADVPPELDALVDRMLAKSPAARPQDGAALALELEELKPPEGADGAPISLSQPAVSALTGAERRVLSVLVIGGSGQREREERDEEEAASSQGFTPRWGSTAQLARLQREAEMVGGHLEYLVDGSIVVALRGAGVAKDRVALAARFALSLRDIVGDHPMALATGRGESTGRLPFGEAIEQATRRLEQLASRQEATGGPTGGPTPIAIDSVTAALLEPRFEWREGEAGPVLLREVEQAEATRTVLGKLTSCVGREREIRMLQEAFELCVEEPEAQVVLVTAPAGVGKSRLAQEFLRWLRRQSEEVEVWIGRGDALRAGSPLGLLAQALRGASGIVGNEAIEEQRQKLSAFVERRVEGAERKRVAAFLGEAIGALYPDEENPKLRAARREAQLMVEQMQRAFEDLVSAACAASPLVLLFEDLHWGDAPTVRFVDAALRSRREQPLLVLALARPEVHDVFPRLWAERRTQEISLRPLTRKASEKLVRQVLGDSLGAAAVERLVAHAEGNAFYLEELIRAAAEGKHTLPETVVAMVQSRLERLDPEARRLLRASSIFGEVFWQGAALSLLGGEARSTQVRGWFSDLEEQEIITRAPQSRFEGEEELTFRHALLREGAYSMLAEADRVLGHKLAAEWLEQHGEQDPRVLAGHFELGGERRRAALYYLQAAERSYDASDMSAASSWAARGLGCGAEGEIKGALLAIQAGVYVGHGRYDDVLALGDEALALLPPGGKRWYMAFQQLFTVVTLAHPEGLLTLAPRLMSVEPSPEASGHYIRAAAWLVASLGMIGAKEEMGAVMERMKRHLAGLDQSDASAWGHYCAALTSHYQLIEERPWRRAQSCKKGCEGYREADLRRDQYMMDVYYGKALQDLGDYAQAEVVLRANLAQAEQLNEPFSIIMAKIHVARLLAAAATPDKLDEAYRLTEDAIHLKGIVADVARETRAEIKLRQGDAASAEQEASMACKGMTATPAYKWPAVALWTWSLLEQGRSAEALEVSEEGVREIERLGLEGHGEVGLRLARAEARWATGQEEAARDALLKTLEQLRLRVDDIPDAAARVRYLTVIPANVRLLTRAKEWLGDEVVRSFMVASDGG